MAASARSVSSRTRTVNMKPHLRHAIAGAAVLAFLCVIALPLGAQDAASKIGVMPPGGPAPRSADGHPDLSGVWWPNRTGIPHVENRGVPVDPAALRQFDASVTPEAPPAFQPWAAARMKAMTAAERELAKGSVNCIPRGLPAI